MSTLKQSDDFKAFMKEQRRAERERKAKLTAEEREYEKQMKEIDKAWKITVKRHKKLMNAEIRILRYMKKTGVNFHHHGEITSIDVMPALNYMIERKKSSNDHSYCWNTFHGLDSSLLEFEWSSNEFSEIHDVPLDGSYIFQAYDSGQRGCGAVNYITAVHVEDEPYVPFVSPGSFPPITAR